jgi:hypothetical protein
MQVMRLTNKDSIERSAPGRVGMQARRNRAQPQCYEGLNEPGQTPLPFAFGAMGVGETGLRCEWRLSLVFESAAGWRLVVGRAQR